MNSEIRNALVSMECTAQWLENGCDAKKAAKEIRLTMERLRTVRADGGKESASDALQGRVTHLLVDLHASETVSEQQCAKVLGIDLLSWREVEAGILPDVVGRTSSSNARLPGADIEAGWHKTFSTGNPYCPCDLKSFTKAVRWAEAAIAKEPK